MLPFLPYGRQVIEDDDVAAVVAALKSDYLTTGPQVAAFEEEFARAVGAPEAVVCNSGTAALHLATLALDIGPGDVAIVPAITFAATANALRYVGADVVFADVDPATGLAFPEHFEAAVERATGRRIKAFFPVHMAGQAAAPPALSELAARHGARIVEDACHALGTRYGSEDWRVGACAHSDLASFSFHPVKTIAMGEGGAVTTRDPALARRMRRLRSHGIERNPSLFRHRDLGLDASGSANPWYQEMVELGLNYRAPDIQCALGISQLRKLPRFLERRTRLVAVYDQALAPLAPLVRPLERTDCRPGWHLNVVRIDFQAAGIDRAAAMRGLHDRGIGSQVHYLPVPWHPYYSERAEPADLPGARAYYESCLSLPLYPTMSDDDVIRVTRGLGEVLGA